ncbi:MAG: N-acetylmuramoyl-L-alanine amidase [Acidobacteriota bacterium]
MLKISDHKLRATGADKVSHKSSPNIGKVLARPRYLIMHYTAGRGFERDVSWLCNPDAKASAHLVIGRDGEIAQLVPFDRVAWHAGKSRWMGLKGLNAHSIGIELSNAGPLEEKADGNWKAWFGGSFPDSEVVIARHRFEAEEQGWHTFGEEQLEIALRVALLLHAEYGFEDVLGHDDIAPKRKRDPGPAFPMTSFRSALLGREDEAPRKGRTTTHLNIRSGPGVHYDKLEASPLAPKTQLTLLEFDGKWILVEVEKNGAPDLTGWVYGDYVAERA